VRCSTLALREREFVDAARAIGASNTRIITRHVIPNCMGAIIVNATLVVAEAILVESTLSFLGFGIQPPTPSWGNLLTDSIANLEDQWWLTVFPGLAIFLTVLAVNFVGDGLRDAFDPRRRIRA
jgi:peptide/nickel transport system permease protein